MLTVARDIEPMFPDKFEYKIIEIMDAEEEDIKQHFRVLIPFLEDAIENRKKRVYVHCAAGVSRSASVVVAYTMWKNKWPLDKALEWVMERRPCIKPNDGFMAQLKQFEQELISTKYVI